MSGHLVSDGLIRVSYYDIPQGSRYPSKKSDPVDHCKSLGGLVNQWEKVWKEGLLLTKHDTIWHKTDLSFGDWATVSNLPLVSLKNIIRMLKSESFKNSASDIFSLGLLVYTIITAGQRPILSVNEVKIF